MKKIPLFLIPAVILFNLPAWSQDNLIKDLDRTPDVIKKLLMSLPKKATGKDFYKALDYNRWNVYQASPTVKKELREYLKHGKSEAGVAFSAVALITFHDASNAIDILDKALDKSISNFTRWYLLNAAPYILSMGDVWYKGKGHLDNTALKFIKSVKEVSEKSIKQGIGSVHARGLLELYNTKKYPKNDYAELRLAQWHQSAYLVGTIDLKDYHLLEALIDYKQGSVYRNIVSSLNFETNRDFFAELRGKKKSEISAKIEIKTENKIKRWWENYKKKYPDGDWKPAVLSGFKEAGYDISLNKNSLKNSKELLRVLDSNQQIYIYNACRLLNHLYSKQFDVERIFLGKKYAFGPFDPSSNMKDLQKQIILYWKNKLNKK